MGCLLGNDDDANVGLLLMNVMLCLSFQLSRELLATSFLLFVSVVIVDVTDGW